MLVLIISSMAVLYIAVYRNDKFIRRFLSPIIVYSFYITNNNINTIIIIVLIAVIV